MQHRPRPWALLVLSWLVAGCPETEPDPGVDAASPDPDLGTPTELDCPGIFDCAAVCADDPCVEACIDRGAVEALELVQAVLVCAEESSCTEETCLEANCAAELAACAGEEPPTCDRPGVPEMTGPVLGLAATYIAGDPIHVSVPVDEDTARVIVGVYEVGSNLYLGGNAEEATPSSTVPVSLYAGVRDGETGTFFLSIELCSTSLCTPPFIRNTYDRADREAPPISGERYQATNEYVGGDAMTQRCPTAIGIQSFEIQ